MYKIITTLFTYLLISGNSVKSETFAEWIENFKQTAIQQGIKKEICDEAFRGLNEPNPKVLEKAQYQPEFVMPVWIYFDNVIHEKSIKTGREMAKKWKNLLDKIEKKYGVDRYILLSIWSLETNYGDVLKNSEVLHDTIHALSTLAYADKKRSKFGHTQLIAALQILQNGSIKKSDFFGSWAGATGHTQFIPTSYQKYAVDMDGDGYNDIWNSVADSLASSANLLKENGWQPKKRWGYEVVFPSFENKLEKKMSLKDWKTLGAKRPSKKSFQSHKDEAKLMVFDETKKGPVFLIMNNFYVIKKYNNSDRYALAVALLADEIAQRERLSCDWQRSFTKLTLEQRKELQHHLFRAGHYNGKIDGKIGIESIKAIKRFQKQEEKEENGYPSLENLQYLRKKSKKYS